MVSVRSRAGRCSTAPGARVTSTTLKVGEPSSSRSVQCIRVPTSVAECSIASVSRCPIARSKSSPGVRMVVVSGSSPTRISRGSSTATVSVRSTRSPVSTSSRVRRTRVVTRPMPSSKHTTRTGRAVAGSGTVGAPGPLTGIRSGHERQPRDRPVRRRRRHRDELPPLRLRAGRAAGARLGPGRLGLRQLAADDAGPGRALRRHRAGHRRLRVHRPPRGVRLLARRRGGPTCSASPTRWAWTPSRSSATASAAGWRSRWRRTPPSGSSGWC